jgi:cytidylate kinase
MRPGTGIQLQVMRVGFGKENTMNFASLHLTEALVRAGQHWQTQKEKEDRDPLATPKFTIALSRQVGARGTSVARVVGARLGWPVYDRELLEEIGKTMKVRADILKSVDERRVSSMQECIEALTKTLHVQSGTYFRHLLDTLLSLGLHGECIIVGRGAAQVLPPATTLRIRLVGKIEDRIAVMMKELDVNAPEAARHIESTDLERSRFVREHFHKDPADPLQYDVVLNSSRFSNEECASVIVQALQQMQHQRSGKSLPIGA